MLFRESITGTVFVGSLNLLPRIQKHPLQKKTQRTYALPSDDGHHCNMS